ncbi:hypothetical protein [Motiliproteus sp. MSK22-1]|uniref:hypothetical protein n=1 Tax=Motiliproteus sp. MSK22-1 TaxID=1897630 RepID=UPI000976FF97|nr:hypothetical protein [Motiliproteus sp. MSK22-1]OMH39663.1 hypothetical protein BGP75_02155 [Motiliproteus sp. MSK22-1]
MFDKPLFNRKQLNIIIIVTLIAIVLLTASGNRPLLPELSLRQIHQVPVYWAENGNDDSLFLSFSFALPPTRMGDHPDTRLLFNQLHKSLNQLSQLPDIANNQAEIALRSLADRLQITLKIPNPVDEASRNNVSSIFTLLFSHLQNSLDPSQWQQEQKKQSARSYLDNQSTSSSLLQLQQWLRDSVAVEISNYRTWQNFKHQLLSRSQLRIAMLSPDPDVILKQLQDTLPLLPLSDSWQPTIPTNYSLQQRTTSTLGNYHLWMARHTAGKESPAFMDQLVALRQIRELATALNINSDLTTLAARSQLLLHLNTSDTITAQSVMERLQLRLLQTDNKTLNETRQKMIDSLHENSQNPSLLFEQLESIAFYQLPVDYLQQLDSRLELLSHEELRKQINSLLDLQMYHWILETPATP